MDLPSIGLLFVGIVAFATVTSVVLTVATPIRDSWIRRLSKRAAIESAGVEAEMERMRERIAELEGRLDFAERMLAQRGETASRLPPGQ
jgi:hypothetical protein